MLERPLENDKGGLPTRIGQRLRALVARPSLEAGLDGSNIDHVFMARLAAGFVILGGLAAIVTLPFRAFSDDQRAGTVMVAIVAIAVGSVAWRLPWQRWRPSATLMLVAAGLLLGSVGYMVALNPYEMATYYVAGFVWIGASHPQGTSLRMLPLLWIAYLLPLLVLSQTNVSVNHVVSGLITMTILCVIVGETLAWLVSSLRRVHEDLAIRRMGSRYRALVQNSSDLVAVVAADASILYMAPSVERLLGLTPAELTTRRLTELLVDDAAAPAGRLLERLGKQPGASATQEWRVAHADGSTRVIEAVAVNLADDPDIGGIVVTGRDVTDRHALEAQLSHEALHDALTGLANRILFRDRLSHTLTRSQRRPEQLGVLFLDIDEFKDVNDSLGHEAGDIVLRTVAERLSACVRDSDTVARLGGDEFAILIEDGDGAASLSESAERLLTEVRRPIPIGDTELELGASVGVVVAGAGTGADDAEALVRDADIAMYAAKELGKDRVELFHPAMQARITERLQLVADLRAAIEEGELEVVYQPFIELATERMVGVEALVRWRHPERGLLMPAVFIGAAEESGLIVELGDFVLREACMAARTWSAIAPDLALVSVNLSPRQFNDESLLARIESTLTDTGLPAGLLVLEITENVLIGDLPAARTKLHALRSMGVRIAIDDFGMGYSSLNYLRALPVDILKIDRAFVNGLGTDEGADALVAAIIQMALVMDLDTIAEAVEQPCEAARLRELGCHLTQGFHYARPMSAAAIAETWLDPGRSHPGAAVTTRGSETVPVSC